ncbi:FACT complex subunit Ssrp1 [Phymastichus coffea]|nr:FACT complex subunit Ssrp1 [Phymastichus coffea]
MDFLEYNDITAEVKGAMAPGRLKLTDQHLIFKNQKTGKVEQIPSSEMEMVNFQKFVGSWGIRIFLKNGMLHRFRGFREGDQEKIAKFFKSNYNKDMLEKELSLKGWNWGTAKFYGSVLSFDVGHHTAFEIPLYNVSSCTTGKNEVTLEFHQSDDAPVSLMEMRFHIPTTDTSETDPVDQFHKEVMDKASVINISGDAIAIFREIQCLTPRGRYDVKIFQSFFQLHGKTFDYKIPITTVIRLFVLPHKDSRQTFFVVSLDPPIKQGQTRYQFLVLLFSNEEETSLELPFTEEELKDKYEDKLTKELKGPTFEVFGKIMKTIINRKITGPGHFVGHSNSPAIGCSYKAAAGYLYPLERGFIYVHKPPIHIRFEEISSVNFARGGGSTRSFDFEIELKNGTQHTFSSIEKEEYGKLFDFINNKKLHVKNRGKGDKLSYKDDFGDSDQEEEPDAYLARVKAEAKERDEDDDDDDDDESTDEDFKPTAEESDVAEEYDSNPNDTSDSDADSDAGSDDSSKKGKKEKKEKKKSKSAKTVSEKPRKPRISKKEKDENKPKRGQTAYMYFLNSVREEIKAKNPGIKVTEVSQKGGEMWKELKDKSKFEKMAAEDKERYAREMKEYKASGQSSKVSKEKKKSEKKTSTKKDTKKESPSKAMAGGVFKSKEYISDVDSSSNDGSSKSKPQKRKHSSSEADSDKSEKEDKKTDKKPVKNTKSKKESESEVSDAASEEDESAQSSEIDSD